MEVIKLETIDSTNGWAKDNIENLSDRTIVLEKKQTSGRGRLNRSWVDLGDNNLFLSFVLKPSDRFNEFYPNLTQYLSVVLVKTIESYGISAQIKWPNDVLISGKKIAGILSETVMQGQILKGIVLGLGVNLNVEQSKLSLVSDKIITSLNLEVGKNIDLEFFVKTLCEEFFRNYDEFLGKGFELIADDYVKKLCVLNKPIEVQVFNRVEKGLAKEINSKGELILEKDNNEEIVLTIGDIL